jgi:hypothetical protein
MTTRPAPSHINDKPTRCDSARVGAVSGAKKEDVTDSHGMVPAGSTKAIAFWANCRERRSQPGNCSRCGRPNDTVPIHAGKRSLCSRCREYVRQYKARRLAERLESGKTASPDVVALLRRVRCLELRQERFARILRAQYKAGYQVGQKAERKRWRNMPRDWDSFVQPVGIEEGKRQFHRLAITAGDRP